MGGLIPRFDAIGIVVADIDAAIDFYRRLGLEVTAPAGESGGHAELGLPGGLRLMLDTEATITSFDPDYVPPPRDATRRIGLAFLCDDPGAVDATYADLTGAGYESHLEPWDAFWGQRYAAVRDPDGNIVDLFAPLG